MSAATNFPRGGDCVAPEFRMYLKSRYLSYPESCNRLQPIAEIIRLDRLQVPARVRVSVVWEKFQKSPKERRWCLCAT